MLYSAAGSTFMTYSTEKLPVREETCDISHIDPSKPVVCLAAARCGVERDQLVPISLYEYIDRYRIAQLADAVYNLDCYAQQRCFKEVADELARIEEKGISVAEYVLFKEHPSLRQYVQFKQEELELDCFAKFYRALATEASQIRYELLKKLKTMVLIESKQKQLRSVVQLSDKEIAARQNMELKERYKTEQNKARAAQFVELQTKRLERSQRKSEEQLRRAEDNYQQLMGRKVQQYQQRVGEHAARTKVIQREKYRAETLRQTQILRSLKRPVSGGHNGRYVLYYRSPFKERQDRLTKYNAAARATHQLELEEKACAALDDAADPGTNCAMMLKRRQEKMLPFQLKCKARQGYALEHVRSMEISRQNALLGKIHRESSCPGSCYSQYKKMIGVNERVDKEQQHRTLRQLQEKYRYRRAQEQCDAERQREAERLATQERGREYQKRLQDINYTKDQLRFLEIGSVEYNQYYFKLHVLMDELLYQYG